MGNRDKDFRFMALSDLANELPKDTFKLDGGDTEKKICSSIVQLLDDSSGDVQGLAVKCLGLLVPKIKEAQLHVIVDTLGDYVLQNKKETLRDIAGIGLKSVIAQTPPESPIAPSIVQRVTPKLIKGVQQEEPEIVLECLGVLNDLLKRFATLMDSDHEKIQKSILPHLTSTRVAARKRAIACLGYLSISTPEKLFGDLVSYILSTIEKSKKADHIRTLISVIGAISRSVGYRLGKFLEDKAIIPLLVKYLHDDRFENDDELRENCFQTFESLVLRCPAEIRPFLDSILKQCLEFVAYDPNVAEDEEEGEDDDEGSEQEEFSDEEDVSDDDDMSWKVRRSAAKCLASVITTRPDLLEDLYKNVVPAIITRFKEREENVKLDIFAAFIDVLKQTTLVSRGATNQDEGVVKLLKDNVPSLVANLTKELKSKTIKVKTRIGIYQLLKELATATPGILADHVGALVPGVVSALSGKGTNATTKMEALTCLRTLLVTHKAVVFHPYVEIISAPVFAAVGDSYYKITAEALRVSAELVTVIRPHGVESSFDYKPYGKKIYDAIFAKYDAQDIDQEVKDSAINCMGLTIAHLGDALPDELLKKALKILADRLHNEITRLTSVHAVIAIASSPLNVDLRSILETTIKALSDFLRQNNRQLKQASLKALAVLTGTYGKDISPELFTTVLNEVANLVSDADLHLSHLSLRLVEAVIAADEKALATVQSQIYPKVLELVQSNLLQGLALESMLSLYSALVTVNAKKFGFNELLDSLLNIANTKALLKQSQSSIAQCVASLCVNAKEDQRNATVERFIDEVKKAKKETSKIQALLCLGEIGRRGDLSEHKALQSVILGAMDGTEDEKSAASFALGNVAVGNVEKFLPSVLKEIKETPKKQYLLMHSLEEIITRSTGTEGVKALMPYLPSVLELLFENTESEEEGTRNVVAKCLGKFALISPKDLLPALQKRVSDPSPLTRSTVVTAVKFAIVDYPHEVDAVLQPVIGDFLNLLRDKELDTRRAALLTLNYAAHNKPSLVRPVLVEYLEALYEETKVKEELIKVVNLGPFKHKVDEGLENRKVAFECMYTLLDTCIDKLDITAFTKHLVAGLDDVYDIKLLCFLMLSRLAQHAGPALVTALDSLVEPLKKTLTTKVRDTAVKQQVDRNDELIRSALVAIAAISRIEDVDSSLKFDEFIKQNVKTGPHAEAFEAILKETAPKQNESA